MILSVYVKIKLLQRFQSHIENKKNACHVIKKNFPSDTTKFQGKIENSI